MGRFYVFDSESVATSAENYICAIAQTPIVGHNAKTGKLESNKAKTERWAVQRERNDGKWVFPIIPYEIAIQFPLEVSDTFNTNYPNVKEEFDMSWFEELVEISGGPVISGG
jgi:hypothetical protein